MRYPAFWGCVVGLACASSASATILENFDSGTLSGYSMTNPSFDNGTVTSSAAYQGSYGASFAGAGAPTWYYRNDVTTEAGNSYFGFVRTTNANDGALYLGVDAGAAGTVSAVFDPRQGQLRLQDNSNWQFQTLEVASFSYAKNTWYQLELNWIAVGQMQARLWDESGTSLLAATDVAAVSDIGGGGLAIRGFTESTNNSVHLDMIYANAIPAPGVLALLGLAGLVGRRRRRG